MKTSERHRLKENEFALVLGYVQTWLAEHQRLIWTAVVAVAIVGGGLGGYLAWKRTTDAKARGMLAEAMIIEESRVQPIGPPAGTTTDPSAIPGQAPGTYPTEQAKLEAALPKFLAAADAYPKDDNGIAARYHAATTLVGLGRFDEAVKQYDLVMASGTSMLARMSRLGKAEAQLRAAQYDPAITTLKAVAEQTDSGLPAEGVLMELARAYTLAGKPEDARKALAQIVEQHADSPFAAEAKKALEKIKG